MLSSSPASWTNRISISLPDAGQPQPKRIACPLSNEARRNG